MRIIAGSRRGMTLFAPTHQGTRPTESRVKENLFNLLGDVFRGRKVLDAFAGSGALGLEALSRGAKSAVFYEKDKKTFDVLRKNLEKARFQDQSSLRKKDMRHLFQGEEEFDLVFLDPPYQGGDYEEILKKLRGHLHEGALIVVERSVHEPLDYPEGYELLKSRRYRETVVEIGKYIGHESDLCREF